MRPVPSLAIDVGVVGAFAAAGLRSHDEGGRPLEVLVVAAPFVIALGVAWLAARAWRSPDAAGTGAAIWLVTATGGLALRAVAFDRGVAPAFVAVAIVTLGVLLMGWRVAARRAPRRHPLR